MTNKEKGTLPFFGHLKSPERTATKSTRDLNADQLSDGGLRVGIA